jgi:hypothetical protein
LPAKCQSVLKCLIKSFEKGNPRAFIDISEVVRTVSSDPSFMRILFKFDRWSLNRPNIFFSKDLQTFKIAIERIQTEAQAEEKGHTRDVVVGPSEFLLLFQDVIETRRVALEADI